MYNCISHKLKFVTVKGFKGKEQEVQFLKHLITRAHVMEKINIICDPRKVDEALDLLSLPRASVNLSIIVKPKNNIQLWRIFQSKRRYHLSKIFIFYNQLFAHIKKVRNVTPKFPIAKFNMFLCLILCIFFVVGLYFGWE